MSNLQVTEDMTKIWILDHAKQVLHQSIVLKRELSGKVKLSVFELILGSIITNGHKFWVMTERVQSQMQVSEMRFLQKINSVINFITLRFENLSTLSCCFFISKELSICDLAM